MHLQPRFGMDGRGRKLHVRQRAGQSLGMEIGGAHARRRDGGQVPARSRVPGVCRM